MAATAEPQGIGRLTLLRSGGESAGIGALDTQFAGRNAKEAIKIGKELRKVAASNSKEAIKNVLAIKEGETHFNIRKMKDFKERFGAGKKAGLTPEEKASQKRATDLLTDYAKVSAFLEVKAMSPAEITTYLADTQVRDAIGGTLSFNELKKQALDFVVAEDNFKSMFPEINLSGLSDAQKRDFVEKTLMPSEDGRLASRIGTRLQEAYKKTIELTPIASDEKKANLDQQEKIEKGRFDQKVKSLKDLVTLRGILNPVTGVAYTEIDITTILKGSADATMAADTFAQHILNQTPRIYSDLKSYRLELNDQLLNLDRIITPKLAARQTLVQYYADPLHAHEPEVINHNIARGKYNAIDALYRPRGVPSPTLATFDRDILPLLGDPAFSTLASQGKQAELKAADMALQKLALPATTVDITQSHDKRMLEEEDICGLLSGILGQSVGDVLEERYDIMEERQGRLMEQNAKKADQDVAKLILELKKKMSKNWIGFDATTHKRTVDKKTIKKDVVHLTFSADKDMALKQLIARDLFGIGNYDRLNVVDGTDGAGTVLLDETKMGQLNKIFESSGQAYRDKLWADMFAARGFMDKQFKFLGMELGSTGKLGFKSVEMQEMVKLYQPEIMKGIEGNQEAARAMKDLEAQGIQFNHPMKWLYYILAVLFGGLGVAAVLPVGIAAGSSALGSVAAGTFPPLAAEAIAGAAAGGLGGAAVVNKFSEN